MKLDDISNTILDNLRENSIESNEFIALYIALTVYDQEKGRFYLEDSNLPLEAQRELVSKVVDQFIHKGPQLETLKLQVSYDILYLKLKLKRQQELTEFNHSINRLIDDIVNSETRGANDFEGISKLYKKIFRYLLFKNNHYSQKKTNRTIVEREVAASLESVLPRTELRPYTALSTADKVGQMHELSNIVLGIRLFNRAIDKGGVGLSSFDELYDLMAGGNAIDSQLNNFIVELVNEIENYSHFLKMSAVWIGQQGDRQTAIAVVARAKSELVFVKQCLTYLNVLQEEAKASAANIDDFANDYENEINDLKDKIGNKASIPKNMVYPKFEKLSKFYIDLMEEKHLYEQRASQFEFLLEQYTTHKFQLGEQLIKDTRKLVGALKPPLADPEPKMHPDVTSLDPNDPEYFNAFIDLQGVCLVTLVDLQGAVVDGKPELGVFKYKNLTLIFDSLEAIVRFYEDPARYFDGLRTLCTVMPELIHLLKITDYFPSTSVQNVVRAQDGSIKSLFHVGDINKLDKGVETATEAYDKGFIDKDYEWDEWTLRRKVLQLADLRKKQTKGTQTLVSHFKRESETQCYLMKDAAQNTEHEKGIDAPRYKKYMVGLRNKDSTNFVHLSEKFK